jgi:small basic protein
VGAQIYKARVTLTARERQQVKWVLFGVFLGVGLFPAFILPVMAFPRLVESDSPYYLIMRPLATLILLSGPIAFAIAVFRARLWDIDLIINRALVYGCLTGILAAIYIGLVIGAQAVVQGLSGPRAAQPLIVVASTLLIAGLFQPLRRRLQRTIDRRFFRSKYDAHKTLAAFSATLQQEVSLLELQKQLIGVVNQTMQPVHVSLWLRPAPPAGAQELSEGGRQ